MLAIDQRARFEEKCEWDFATGCVLWRGAIDTGGYGAFYTRGASGGRQIDHKAHRWIYEQVHGPVGDLVIDHLCRVRHCVNPAHLEAVTAAENTRRGAAARTHCKNGHLKTDENAFPYFDHKYGVTRFTCNDCRIANYQRNNARKSDGRRGVESSAASEQAA